MILPVPIAASKAEDGGASSSTALKDGGASYFTALKDSVTTSTCSKDQCCISIDALKEDVVISSTSVGFLKYDITFSTSIAEEDGGAYIASSDASIFASSKDQGRISIAPIDATSVDAWKDDGGIFSPSVEASNESSDFSTASKDDGGNFTHLTNDGSLCIDPVIALKDDGGNISVVSVAASKAGDRISTVPISGSICIFPVAALKDDGGISIAPVAASEMDANISIAPLTDSKADDAKFTVPCIVPVATLKDISIVRAAASEMDDNISLNTLKAVNDISTISVTTSKTDGDGDFFTSPVAASEDGGSISMEDDGYLLSSHGFSMEDGGILLSSLISEIEDVSCFASSHHHSNILSWNEDFNSGDNDYLDSSVTPHRCFTFLCNEVEDSSSASGPAQTGGGNAAEALALSGGGLYLAARVLIRASYISAFRLVEMGNYTEAGRIVNNLVEEHPNQSLAYVAEANIQYWIACLCCVQDISSLKDAETSARKAMSLSPQSTYVKWLLASILLDLGYCKIGIFHHNIMTMLLHFAWMPLILRIRLIRSWTWSRQSHRGCLGPNDSRRSGQIFRKLSLQPKVQHYCCSIQPRKRARRKRQRRKLEQDWDMGNHLKVAGESSIVWSRDVEGSLGLLLNFKMEGKKLEGLLVDFGLQF